MNCGESIIFARLIGCLEDHLKDRGVDWQTSTSPGHESVDGRFASVVMSVPSAPRDEQYFGQILAVRRNDKYLVEIRPGQSYASERADEYSYLCRVISERVKVAAQVSGRTEDFIEALTN